MAITVPTGGAGVYGSGNSGGNPSCTIPAVSGGVLANDGIILVVNCHKAAARTESFPIQHSTRPKMKLLGFSDGNTQATATDTGPTLIAVYWEIAAGGESGTVITNIDGFTSGTSGTSSVSRIIVIRKTTGNWSTACVIGADNVVGTAWSVTWSHDPGIASGDFLLFGNALPTDANPVYGSEVIAATGATLAAPANVAEAVIAAGLDSGGKHGTIAVTAGTATAPPTWTSTLSGTTTNAAGPAILVRFREAVVPPILAAGRYR